MEGSIEDFCYRVLDLHRGILFAGLASSSGEPIVLKQILPRLNGLFA